MTATKTALEWNHRIDFTGRPTGELRVYYLRLINDRDEGLPTDERVIEAVKEELRRRETQ